MRINGNYRVEPISPIARPQPVTPTTPAQLRPPGPSPLAILLLRNDDPDGLRFFTWLLVQWPEIQRLYEQALPNLPSAETFVPARKGLEDLIDALQEALFEAKRQLTNL